MLLLTIVMLAFTANAQVIVTPHVLEIDLRKLPASPVYEPGKPIQEIPDLRRSDVQESDTVTLQGRAIRLVNRNFVVYSAEGARLAGPVAFGSLWPPSSEPCGVDVEWPPTVQVDRQAGRWLISRRFQPLPDGKVPYCVAVSRASDPLAGGWWLYGFVLPIRRSEGTLDLTGGAYRLPGESDNKPVVITFDRAAMLAGQPAGFTISAQRDPH